MSIEQKRSAKINSLPDTHKCVKKTSYKYNGGQNYRDTLTTTKYVINIDKYEMTLRGQFLRIEEKKGVFAPPNVLVYNNGDIILERDQERWNGVKHYKYAYLVIAHGESVGTILTSPRNSHILDASLSQFRFDNHVLYRKDFIKLFDEIIGAIGLEVNNATGIDIAVDGSGFMDQFNQLMSGQLRKVGKAGVQVHLDNKMNVDGFDIGSKASSKKLTAYRKGKLVLKEGKDYIVSNWEQNGLLKTYALEQVERLEVKLKSAYLKEIEDFDYRRLEDSSYLAGLMKKALEKFYQFVEPSEKKGQNITRQDRIESVDWDYFKAVKVEKLKTTKRPPNVIWRLKHRVAFDMLEYYAKVDGIANSLFEQTLVANRALCEKYGVLDWFDRKLIFWSGQREYHLAIENEIKRAAPRNAVYKLAAGF